MQRQIRNGLEYVGKEEIGLKIGKVIAMIKIGENINYGISVGDKNMVNEKLGEDILSRAAGKFKGDKSVVLKIHEIINKRVDHNTA
ncbi:unnamed protein product [Dovyalis caffra]|uniref:Uncharacterized protein n=1 Tax=Dovyalis caffra TaxID=77055 RepID=A0AAV1SMB4_9ROSI|nr:unnamed protein product [Dovyalis caffra]